MPLLWGDALVMQVEITPREYRVLNKWLEEMMYETNAGQEQILSLDRIYTQLEKARNKPKQIELDSEDASYLLYLVSKRVEDVEKEVEEEQSQYTWDFYKDLKEREHYQKLSAKETKRRKEKIKHLGEQYDLDLRRLARKLEESDGEEN